MNLTMLHTGPAVRRWFALAALATAVLLAGCGDKKEGIAGPIAAKVNKDEVTVQQVNFVLQQQRNLRPEQADAASKQILERLIDQQLAVQKADDLKLDRDPRVVQQLEAVRREVLARAYVEKIGEAAAKPTPEEIKKYYDDEARAVQRPPHLQHPGNRHRSPARSGAGAARPARRQQEHHRIRRIPQGQRLPVLGQPGRARRRAVAAEQPGRVRAHEGRPGCAWCPRPTACRSWCWPARAASR